MTGKSAPIPPQKCPCCPEIHSFASPTGHSEETPRPGDFNICRRCGALLQFGEALELIERHELPADMEPEQKRALHIARLYIREGPESYVFAVAMIDDIVAAFLEQYPGIRPAFIFPKEVCVAAGLDVIGPRIIKNGAAKALVISILRYFQKLEREPPTVTMLLVALKEHGIEPEDCSLAEIGLEIPKA